MKILLIGITPPEEGGSERHIYEISKRLNNVTVLTQKPSLCENKIELPVIRVSGFVKNISFFMVCLIYSLKLMFGKKRFDVVHIHENLLYFLAPLLRFRYEIVITVHGLRGFKFYDSKFLWFFFSWALKRAHKIVTHGVEETDIIKKMHKNVRNIPDGVDLTLYAEINPKTKKKITFVGRIHEQKGIKYLLEAFEIISKKYPSYELEIIAKKNDLYKELAKKHPSKKINWRGFILDRGELFREISSSEILVYPSLWEALPWPALLEGMASGRPVVASNLYGMRSVFKDKKNILLAKPRDAEDLAEKIASLIKNKGAANSIGKDGKKLVHLSYNLDNVINDLNDYYNEELK